MVFLSAKHVVHLLTKCFEKDLSIYHTANYWKIVNSIFLSYPILITAHSFATAIQPQKIEKVQKRALRFISDDYNSTYETLRIEKHKPPAKPESTVHAGAF